MDEITLIESKAYNIKRFEPWLDSILLNKLFKEGVLKFLTENLVSFSFVGIISLRNVIIGIIPKVYVQEDGLKVRLISTIKSLKKYSANNLLYEGVDYFSHIPDEKNCSELGIAHFLIQDYQNHGIYQVFENRNTINGEGATEWDKTIQYIDPVFSNSQPIYVEQINSISTIEENNTLEQIHKWSINYVVNKYAIYIGEENTVINYNTVEIVEEIAPTDYLLHYLRTCLINTFTDRGILIIKSLIFLIEKNTDEKKDDLSLYGTKRYEYVWETICKELLDHKKEFTNYFPDPEWSILGETYIIKNTLIPDIVTCDFKSNYYLMDAKYYNLQFTDKLSGNPGSKDVLKQFMYQIHIEKKLYKKITNGFLFPIDDSVFIDLNFHERTIVYNEEIAQIGSIKYALFEGKEIFIYVCPLSLWQNKYYNNGLLDKALLTSPN